LAPDQNFGSARKRQAKKSENLTHTLWPNGAAKEFESALENCFLKEWDAMRNRE